MPVDTRCPKPEIAGGAGAKRRGCVAALLAAALLGAGLAAAIPAGARADAVDDCRQNQDLVAKIESCTGLAGPLDGSIGTHAWALVERANGWCWLGEAEPAIVDIWAWFDADPAAIRRMQAKLAALGFYAGEIDGGYSAALDDAVVAWAEAGCPEGR